MNRNMWKGMLFLLMASFFWGTTFVAQDLASDSVGPFTFNGLRMTLGGLILLPVGLLGQKKRKEREGVSLRPLLVGAAVCGVLIFFAAGFQQTGITVGTSAGKSGFITAMYVILVPLIGLLFKKKPPVAISGCAVAAVVGLYFICMADIEKGWQGLGENLTVSGGDLLTFCCAVFFEVHILAVDRFAPQVNGVLLSSLQFLLAGAMALVVMWAAEQPRWADIVEATGGILYSAVFSCGIVLLCGRGSRPSALFLPVRNRG